MNIITKTAKIIRNWIKSEKEILDQKRRAKQTKVLRNKGESDIERWKKNTELHLNWNERTAIIAKMIPSQANIIEFGAGNMELKNLISNDQRYTASDICERYPGTLICDLNKEINLNLDPYDTAVFSGVLEYVYDVNKIFAALKRYDVNHVVLSYACSDISKAPRLERGWLSDFTRKELEKIFSKYNFEILEYSEWRKQSVYHLILK